MSGALSGFHGGASPDPPSASAVEGIAESGAGVRAGVWVCATIIASVVACFAPALHAEFVDWDDSSNLVENPYYRGLSPAHLRWMFTTMHGGHYQPLSWVTFALDYHIWGMQPHGYHLTNVILHTANALLVYGLALALLPRTTAAPAGGRGIARPFAAGVAALCFAIHPLRVESVAWVTERRDVLSAFFLLLTVLAYLRMARARPSPSWRTWYALALGCYILSLLSKAWGMTLPVVLLILDAYPLRRLAAGRDEVRRALLEKLPFLALAGMTMVLAVLAQRPAVGMRTLAEHGVAARAVQASYGLMFYLWKTLLPIRLSPLYLLDADFQPAGPRYLACALAVLAMTAVLVRIRRRWPWALAAWACYVVVLSPVLGFLQTGPQLVADRYSYLACLPWAIVAGAAVCHIPSSGRPVWVGVIGVALVALSVQTFRQVQVWTDTATLWEHVLRLDPANYVANVNRAAVQIARGDLNGAVAAYDLALRANPQLAIAYRGRAFARHQRGDLRGAIADYTSALQLEPEAAAYRNRGVARQALGDLNGALADYTASLQLNADDPQAYNNRGWLRRQGGDVSGAISDFERALEVAPPEWPYRAQTEDNLREARVLAPAGP